MPVIIPLFIPDIDDGDVGTTMKREKLSSGDAPNAGVFVAPKEGEFEAPKAGVFVAPKAGVLDAPNEGVLVAPKEGVLGAPKAGVLVAPKGVDEPKEVFPNAGWDCCVEFPKGFD